MSVHVSPILLNNKIYHRWGNIVIGSPPGLMLICTLEGLAEIGHMRAYIIIHSGERTLQQDHYKSEVSPF